MTLESKSRQWLCLFLSLFSVYIYGRFCIGIVILLSFLFYLPYSFTFPGCIFLCVSLLFAFVYTNSHWASFLLIPFSCPPVLPSRVFWLLSFVIMVFSTRFHPRNMWLKRSLHKKKNLKRRPYIFFFNLKVVEINLTSRDRGNFNQRVEKQKHGYRP